MNSAPRWRTQCLSVGVDGVFLEWAVLGDMRKLLTLSIVDRALLGNYNSSARCELGSDQISCPRAPISTIERIENAYDIDE
jgi:hypothetical protein